MCNDVFKEASYILETNVTIREAAKYFGVSKTTIARHMNKLKYIDNDIYLKIKNLFFEHNKIRHINGGLATKKKYLK